MKSFCKILLISISLLISTSYADLKLTTIYKTDAIRMSEAFIEQLVSDALSHEISKDGITEGSAFVYSKQDGKEQYLVVKLLIPNTFTLQIFRLDLLQSKVVAVVTDYQETEDPIDPSVCGTCPDPEVQVVYAYINQFATTKPEVDKVTAACVAAKVKHFVLLNNAESKTSILNWLSCPKLVLYGRVGHGSTTAIQFGVNGTGGSISAADLAKYPIKGKFFPFNSCYVGGKSTTFAKNMLSGGATWLCGGDNVVLSAGSSEPIWAKFMIDVCTKQTEVIATYDKYMKTAKDKWAYQSQGTGPFFPFKGATDIVQPISSKQNQKLPFITVSRNCVHFITVPGTLSIYSLSGELIKELKSSESHSIWDLKNSYNTEVHSGTYIAIVKTNSNTITQSKFSIIR